MRAAACGLQPRTAMLRSMRPAFTLLIVAAACGGPHAGPPANHAGGAGGDGLVATITPFTGTAPAGEDLGEATIRTPLIDVPGNPAASAAINAALDVPNTAAALAEVKELGEVGLDYEVGFNRRGVLDLSITHETMGAYPDSYRSHFLFDLATGKKLTGAELLRADRQADLAARLDTQLQAELADARAHADADCIGDGDDPYQGRFTPDLLGDVGVGDTGLVFVYDFDFPHAIQACEPAGGVYVVPWAEAGPFLVAGTAVAALAP